MGHFEREGEASGNMKGIYRLLLAYCVNWFSVVHLQYYLPEKGTRIVCTKHGIEPSKNATAEPMSWFRLFKRNPPILVPLLRLLRFFSSLKLNRH